jgi:hypothetical protein
LETEATNLFAAAEFAIQEWHRFSWHNPDAPLEIRSGPDRWKVSQARVKEKRNGARPNVD